MPNRSGRESASQTPAPKKDRISGSKVNPKGSASSEKSASAIKLDAKTLTALTNKLKEFKDKHPNADNITLADLKAVYRRGAGAYSTSHRPTISGGKPNSRNAWAMARVNKFLLKAGGTKVKKAYVQDDDLMKMHLGGDMSKHLAPNGKPSNLTHEQWHLVRTPEFKAWFGDWENDPENASKVVDENGEPLVVYHGTPEDFYEFKNRLFSYTGFYFTDKISVARTYGSKIRQYFLNSRDFNRLNMKGGSFSENSDLVDELIDDSQYYYKDVHLLNYVDPQNPKATKGVEASNVFVMFDNRNIKLADGSNTTFDGSNPDIRYADGGQTPNYEIISDAYYENELEDLFENDLEHIIEWSEGEGRGLTNYDIFKSGNKYILRISDYGFDEYNDRYFLINYINPDIKFKDGGEVIDQYTKEKIKKAYVSIRIKKETKEEKEFSYTYIIDSFDEKPFEELKEGELKGVKGISTSNYNVSEWLVHRDCLVMMPFDEFLGMNNAEQVLYYDSNYLTKNGLEPLFRLYDRKTTDDSAYYSILQNLFPKISNEFTIEGMSSTKGDLFYLVGEIFNPHIKGKFIRYVAEQERIQSPEMFAQIVCDYINSGKANEDYYHYKKFEGVEPEDILIPLIKGIEKSGSIYRDESEWILKDDTLRIPDGSQLFFVLTSYSNMKEEYEKMIDAYGLRSKYKIYYVDYKDLSKFQQKRWQKKDANLKKELESFRGDVNKKISNALVDIENEILAEFERNLLREVDADEYLHPESFKDYDGNQYSTYMEIPEVVNFYNNFIYKLSQIIEEAIPQVVSGRNKYYLSNVELQVLAYINLLDEENRYKDFEFMDEYGTKFSYYDLIYKMKRAFKDINMVAYADSIKERVGGDLYRAYSKDELMFKDGGATDKYEISDYWDTELFGEGGEVKTKKIITEKIGWNEEIADWFIEQDPKLSIWLADSVMRFHISMVDSNFSENPDQFSPKFADWNKKSFQEKKKITSDRFKNLQDFFSMVGIDSRNLQRQITSILDWLKHPITPKRDLKNLTLVEAYEKSKQFHDELTALGGDIDFVEPEGNEIFITYPKDNDGAEFYWVKIPSNFCSLESSRMGHCGRTGYGNTLISLRSIRPYGKGHTINDSHVTIAYNEKDGIFYQTKGKKNQKPAEKYHQYIFDLVKTLAQEDRRDYISEVQSKIVDFNEKKIFIENEQERISNEVVELRRERNKLEEVLSKVKNSRDYNEVNNRIDEVEAMLFKFKSDIKDLEFESQRLVAKILKEQDRIDDIEKMYPYGFGGFGAEYGSEEDYGFGEMTDEQVKELYEINPSLFSNLGGRIVLYNRGIVEDKPDTTFILEKDVDQIEDLLDKSIYSNSDFLQSVITGDMYEAIDTTTSDHEVITWYLRELNDKNMNYVLDEISRITSIPIEEVKQNGAKYYLSGDFFEEGEDDFYFDSIIDAIRRAVQSALESDAYDYYYGEIKSALSELGEVLNLNDEGIKIKVELTNALTINQIEQYSQEVGDNLESIFFQAEYNGDITLPKLSFDDRFSPSADTKLINEYFEPDFYAKGGVISDEDKAETYKKWKSLVNMSKSELERFYNSQEGKDAGLSSSEAKAQGIDSGRESSRWIMKMKDTPYKEWTPQMWKWAKKQISFISRMSGNKGGLYDDKGRKTRKHTSLLIWGNNPEKMSGGGQAQYHLGGDMSKHLAPNGKPSKLTHEQWHLVRTPEFKAWFGDWENDPKNASKVVDINGEPLVVFRGDSQKRTIFDEVTFFSSNDYVAGSYSNEDAIPEYQVFLNVRNPLNLLGGNELRFSPSSSRISGSDPNVVSIFKEAISELPNDYKVKVGWGDEWDKETLYNAVIGNYQGIEYIDYNNQSATWGAIIGYAKKYGFDGVFMLDESVDKLIQYQFSQIVFEPEQIKLADGSNTTFDGSNPHIRYARGGKVGSYVFLRFGLPNKNGKGEYTNSYLYIKGQKAIEEGGISVFEAVRVKNGYEVFLSNSRMRSSFDELIRSSKDLYLVEGEYSGNEGSDGEILLDAKTFKVISKVNKDKVSEYNPNPDIRYARVGKTKNDATYKDVVDLLKEYQFRLKPKRDNRYETWRNSTKVNGEEVECFIDTKDKRIVLESQHGLKEIGYDLKFMESYFKKNRLKRNKYEDGGLIVDGKKSTTEELTEIYQSVWRVESYGFELNPHKIQYSGDDEQIIQTIEEYNRLTNPYSSRSGKLKEAYMKQVISNAFRDTPFRKFTNAFRKNIDPYFSSDNNRHVGFKFSSYASYVIGDGSYYVDEEQFRNFAKDLKIKIPERTFDNGGEINQTKNINMDNVRFNQLPHIDTISEGDDIILYESVFAGNIDQPKHIGERYIHCKAMKMGGMVNSLDLEVINSVGVNPLVIGQLITRPITNVLVRGRKLIVEPIAQAIAFKDGGLNPDNKDVKGYFAHGSGNAGGVLVGKRHSEGGIKAINKSTGQPLEMEGGEVVITRGAVSNTKKYDFDGKEMTTREILSKLNVDGGGVSFAEGGDVPDKMNCGCKEFKLGGQTITPQDFVAMSEKEYQQTRLQEGIKKERHDHYDTLSKLNSGAITIDNALREIAQKEMSIDKKYPFSE